ncbi:MAG: ATP-dependent RecD-like DNA helicase [Anaerolineales bacterium]|nr:ATP-dependent RecD-like DNA helicase [Anaerolineales bacterium]
MEQVAGSVTRLVFRNPETTYTILRLAPDREPRLKITAPLISAASRADAESGNGSADTRPRQTSFIEDDLLPKIITVVGDFASVEVGQQLWVAGEWTEHPLHGRQFRADRWKVQLPTTLSGMHAYLASGLMRGIGPSLAAAILETFGEQTFDVIAQAPQRLLDVPGIGLSRVDLIRKVWAEQAEVRSLMVFLQGQGLPPNLALKIHKALGPSAGHVVQTEPYRLVKVGGVGFRSADRIAAQLGVSREAPDRLAAGLRHALETFAEQGHSYMPREMLVEAAAQLLDVPSAPLDEMVETLAASGEELIIETGLGLENNPVYLAPLHRAEAEAAVRLRALAHHPNSALAALRAELTEAQIHWAASMAGQSDLSAEQRLAIRRAVDHRLSVITGGPGTGKTICLRSLVALLELYRFRVALVAPTGRAARRMAEATGHPAWTIHRLLKYSGDEFSSDVIQADVVVVDEASMLDLVLARQLLAALQPGTHLVLVGDVDQLPAVGPGMVLRDVIASGLAAVTRLTRIFRQAQSSLIVTNAHRINQGLRPLTPQRDCDFYVFSAKNALEAADLVVDIACQRIPEQFGNNLGLSDPLRDVQVLAPMYKGRAGIDKLNARLQAVLNPPTRHKAERVLPRCTFRVGDKVMITRNDYEREVSNGEIGYVIEIDENDQALRLDCDGRIVAYDWLETEDLAHAYAVSIHKAQGSEYPAVVIPLLTEHAIMLYRQLLYTAVTRARRLCVLVGSRRAVEVALATNRGPNRYSALGARLVSPTAPEGE